MKKIASFTVNHDKLKKGMYVSRIDGDVVTYDIRMKKPNGGDYLGNGELHTFEHLFATYARNSKYSDSVIYALTDGLPHRFLPFASRHGKQTGCNPPCKRIIYFYQRF